MHNHSMAPAETELALELDADFADQQEAGGPRRQHGETAVTWHPAARALVFDYRVEHGGHALHRALRVRIVDADSSPGRDGRMLLFRIRLPPHGEWRTVLSYDSLVDGVWRMPAGDDRDRLRECWSRERTRVEAAEMPVGLAFERAAEDLAALRNWEYDEAPDAWFPAAGVPSYTGVFGRDSLTAAWQGALIGPEMMRGALAVMARTQAREEDAWRDAEPGKLIHEMRRGPLAELDITPQRAYYGTQTAPAMFVFTLSEYWHWTGDQALLRRYRDVALRTFEWAESRGDRDGDGFLEYVQRSSHGLKNHGWKDSDEAIRYEDGRLVENPIATVEEQAYHFVAFQRMAEILVALEEDDAADRLLARAREFRRRWHDAFWLEHDGFYAMALDPEKRPVRSIASNAGHALAAGIVPPEHARTVADRLLAADLFSGWGVRTLSSRHPSYNPFAYHLGTVWPVENATFALGMKRYGLDEHAARIIEGMLAACACFHGGRLPEAISGHDRAQSAVPSAYPKANSPQAWSASATLQFVQVMLGLYPFAPASVLAVVRPWLPHGLDTLTLRNVRVGDARASLRFERQQDGAVTHELIERKGTLHVLSVPPPQDTRPGEESSTERLKGWLLEHAPGRTARALRIALGLDEEQE